MTCAYSQEAFEMNYGCYRVHNSIKKDKKKETLSPVYNVKMRVFFSIGKNKDIITFNNGVKSVYTRIDEAYFGETSIGTRYQVIPTRSNGVKYLFQYLENYKLRILLENGEMTEYDCIENMDSVGAEIITYKKYFVSSKRAYFHNTPDYTTKREAYLILGEEVDALIYKNNFVYIENKNSAGQISKGWLSLNEITEYY